MITLAGKAIVVTGSGQGIGAAIARGAAAIGASVVINDINPEIAEATAAAIRASGGNAVAHPANVANWDEAKSLIDRCVTEFGAIDGLVNNAGLMHMASIEDIAENDIRRLLDVNVFGVIACTRHAANHMLPRGKGSIVNVTSGAQCGIPMLSLYGATKGAIASFTYTAAMELVGKGIRVNGLAPLSNDTNMRNVLYDYDRSQGLPPRDLGDPIPAETNVPVVLFLLSDAASKVNGQVVESGGNRLGLMSHPANLGSALFDDAWTADTVADAFAGELGQRQAPLGIVEIEISKVTRMPTAMKEQENYEDAGEAAGAGA